MAHKFILLMLNLCLLLVLVSSMLLIRLISFKVSISHGICMCASILTCIVYNILSSIIILKYIHTIVDLSLSNFDTFKINIY